MSGRDVFVSFLKGISNRKVAEQVHPHLLSIVERISRSSPNAIFGVVAMDYPGQDVIAALVRHNAKDERAEEEDETEVKCNCDADLCNYTAVASPSMVSNTILLIAAVTFVTMYD